MAITVHNDSRRLRRFNVSADGLRFCRLKSADEDSTPDQPVVVLNWFEELKARVPTRGQ